MPIVESGALILNARFLTLWGGALIGFGIHVAGVFAVAVADAVEHSEGEG